MPYGCSCRRITLLVERDCLSSIFAVHNTTRVPQAHEGDRAAVSAARPTANCRSHAMLTIRFSFSRISEPVFGLFYLKTLALFQ